MRQVEAGGTDGTEEKSPQINLSKQEHNIQKVSTCSEPYITGRVNGRTDEELLKRPGSYTAGSVVKQ